MRKTFCLLLSFFLALGLALSAQAEAAESPTFIGPEGQTHETEHRSYDFDEAVAALDSLTYNGVKVLTDPDEGVTNVENCRGAVLAINTEEHTARFSLHDNDSKRIHVWRTVDSSCVPYVLDLVLDPLNGYINYANGGKINVYVFDNYQQRTTILDIAYTPYIAALKANEPDFEYTAYYDDWNEFREVSLTEINRYMESDK